MPVVDNSCWSDGRKDILVRVDDDTCPPPMPPLEQMTLWLSWYDPAKCYDENGNVIKNINCDENPREMAAGMAVEGAYGQVCACIPQWDIEDVVHVEGIGSWTCQDRGGDVRPTYRRIYHPKFGFVYMWILPIDVLADYENPPAWEFEPIAPEDWYLVPHE